MNNAVLYLRFSSHSQNEQSIETQRDSCTQFAIKNNINIIGEYIDEAKTGTNDKREGFQQMMKDSKKKAFDYVIIYKVDRFARDKYDSAIHKRDLKKYGVKVLSSTENITDDPQGELMEGILETLAHYYSLNLSKNIKDGMKTNAKKGLSTGGQSLPLGYLSVKETREIIVDEGQALIVVKIFEMYRDKKTMADIIRYLNLNNVKTSRDNEFNKNSIRKILTNKKYIGIYMFKGEEMPVRIPRIVSDDLFNEVQVMINKRKDAPARARAKKEYLLTTKLLCGHCEALMVGAGGTSRNKKVYNYYSCNNFKIKKCDKTNISKELLEDFVVMKAREQLTDESIKTITDNLYAEIEKDKTNNSNIKRLTKAIKDNDKEKNNLLDSLKKCNIDSVRNSIFEELEKMDNSRKQLEIELRYEEANNINIKKPQIRFILNDLKNGDPNDEKYRSMLINTFVYKVYLYNDGKIIIIFTINGKRYEGKMPSKDELLVLLKDTPLQPMIQSQLSHQTTLLNPQIYPDSVRSKYRRHHEDRLYSPN